MLNEIILILLVLSGFLYWFDFQKVKEIAMNATQQYCQAVNVQMLDGYVAANGLKIKKNSLGKWQLQRTFLFEFTSTGEHRYNGKIIMHGQSVTAVEMDPYRLDDQDNHFN